VYFLGFCYLCYVFFGWVRWGFVIGDNVWVFLRCFVRVWRLCEG